MKISWKKWHVVRTTLEYNRKIDTNSDVIHIESSTRIATFNHDFEFRSPRKTTRNTHFHKYYNVKGHLPNVNKFIQSIYTSVLLHGFGLLISFDSHAKQKNLSIHKSEQLIELIL